MADVSYAPGTLIAVAGERCVALVEATPDSTAATWIWQRVAQGTPAETLLAGLLGTGFDGVGGFALLAGHTAGPGRLFCRGQVVAVVEGGAAPGRIDGAGLLTWREHAIAADAERIVLGERPDDGALRLPAAAGVLLAGCVIVDLTGAAARGTSRYDLAAGGYAAVDTITIGGRASGPDAVAAPPVAPPPVVPQRVVPPPVVPQRVVPPPVVPQRVVPRQTREVTRPADDGIVGGATRPLLTGPRGTPRPAAPRPGAPSLIDVVQWGAGSAASGPPPTRETPPAAGPDASELTVGRVDQAARSAPPDRIGPAVPALVCLTGHVNPPSEAACRQCGTPLPNDTVIVPRPVLGILRLSTGDVITLDRDVVLGRNPPADFAGADGEERPHVVRLPSADGDISRTHLRVTLDGWHVLVTDLNSTNGTLVTLPGRDPEQLRRGETVPIRLGTVVTLTEGIDFRYEVSE
jgi:hypothetical protein